MSDPLLALRFRHVPDPLHDDGPTRTMTTQTSEAHNLETSIRGCVLHSRSLSTTQTIERLRAARVTVSASQVEDALLGAPGIVYTSDGRWQRA